MRASIAVAAAVAGLASAAPQNGYGYGGYGEKSVVYQTQEVTVTSCGPEVTNCPAKYPRSSSAPAPVSTPAGYPSKPASTPAGYPVSTPAGYPVSSAPAAYSSAPLVTKTVYQTSLYTVTSCKEYVTNCPAHSTLVYTSVIPAYTTVCPENVTPIYTPPAKPSKPVESASKPAGYPSQPAGYPSQPAGYPSKPVESASKPAQPAQSSPCSTSTTVTVTVPAGYSTPAVPGVPYPSKPAGTGNVPYPPAGTASSSGYVKPSAYPPQFTGAASHAQVGGFVAGVGAVAALFL